MKKFILSIGLLLIVLMSCTKKDDQKELPYLGQWDLVYFTKAGQEETFSPGDIIWEFKKHDKLIVEINAILPPASQLPIKIPGTYKYVGSEFVMSINGVQYAVDIKNDTLSLSHNPATGGNLIKFIK